MTKIFAIVMVVAGVILGVFYFLFKRSPSVERCRGAGVFSREMLFTAIIVSGCLSSLVSLADKATVNSVLPNSKVVKGTRAFEQTEEWHDLKVVWSLVTGNGDILRDRSSFGGFGGVPQWKLKLFRIAVDHRVSKLEELVDRGLMTHGTKKGIEKLFGDMTAHFCRQNWNATCYMMSADSAGWMNAVSELQTQARLAQVQYAKGKLSGDVLKKLEEGIRNHLEVLEVLGEFQVADITEEEFDSRVALWREQGKISERWVDKATRKAIKSEILKEKESRTSEVELDRLRKQWGLDQNTILALSIDLHKYKRDGAKEKDISRDLKGSVAFKHLLESLKDVGLYEKEELIRGISEIGGDEAIPVLKELLSDEMISTFSRTSGNLEDETYYVEYSIRNQAASCLRQLGVDAPDEVEVVAGTPEAIEMVRKGIMSEDADVRRSALRAVGRSSDSSFIPVLEQMLQSDKENIEYIIEALGTLKSQGSIPKILDAIKDGDVSCWSVHNALQSIGGDRAVAFLTGEVESSGSDDLRVSAVRTLCEMKAFDTYHMLCWLLKDRSPEMRLAAVQELQKMGKTDGFRTLTELTECGDAEFKQQVRYALESSKHKDAPEILTRQVVEACDDKDDKAVGKDDAMAPLFAALESDADDAYKAFEAIMKSGTEEQRLKAVKVISVLKSEKADNLLSDTLQDESVNVKEGAIRALMESGTTNSCANLISVCLDPATDETLVMLAERALWEIYERKAKSVLGDLLKDLSGDDTPKKKAAEDRCRNLGNDEIFALIVASDNFEWPYQEQKLATQIVEKCGQRSVKPIIEYYSIYPDDSLEVDRELFGVLNDNADIALPLILKWIRDEKKLNRELGVDILAGETTSIHVKSNFNPKKIDGLRETILALCSDKNSKVRAAAQGCLLEVLGKGQDALDNTIIALKDPDWNVQFKALLYIQFDLDMLDNNPDGRKRLLPALLDLFRGKLEDNELEDAKYILPVFEAFNSDASLPLIQEILDKDDPQLPNGLYTMHMSNDYLSPRQEAAKVLYSIGDESCVSCWQKHADDGDDLVALWSLASLCKYGHAVDANIKRVSNLFFNGTFHTQKVGIEVLRAIGDKRCVPVLVKHLKENQGESGKTIEPKPRTISSSNHAEDRQEALKLLVDIGGEGVIEDVAWFFENDWDGYVRRDAAELLLMYPGPQTESILIGGLSDVSPGVRYAVCKWLGVIGGDNAVKALTKIYNSDTYISKEGSYEVRDAASNAIRMIESTSEVDFQERVMQLAMEPHPLRQWAISQLGNRKGDRVAINTLKDIMKNAAKDSCGHYHIRDAAAHALRKQGFNVIKKGSGVYEIVDFAK